MAVLGALLTIVGSFAPWAQEGSVTVSGIGGVDPELYPELEELFTPGWLTLALALVALGAVALLLARGGWLIALVADLAGTVVIFVAILSIVSITDEGGASGGPDPAWGVIVAGVGGLLIAIGGSMLFAFGGRARARHARPQLP